MARNHLIQLRRDTEANWTSTDPVLAAGEVGLVTDTNELVVGDGATAFSSLARFIDKATASGTYVALQDIVAPPGASQFLAPYLYLSNSTVALVDEQCEFVPILVPDSDTFTAIAVSVSSAGNASSVLRLGIYEDDGGVPGDLVVDGGTVAADSTGDKTTSISEALSPGLYWLAVVPQGATSSPPTVRAGVTLGAPHVYNSFTQLRAAMHYRTSSSVAAALPDPAGTLTYQNSAVPVVSLQRTS